MWLERQNLCASSGACGAGSLRNREDDDYRAGEDKLEKFNWVADMLI